MKISRIDHLGIGVESIDAVLPYFENVLGLKCYAEIGRASCRERVSEAV